MIHLTKFDTLRWLAIIGVCFATGLAGAEPAAVRPGIRVITDKAGRTIAFEATGLEAPKISEFAKREEATDVFSEVLSVSVVGDEDEGDLPAMAGTYAVSGTSLRFTPRYALRPGMRHRAILQPDGASRDGKSKPVPNPAAAKTVTLEVTVPESAAGKPTEVAHVYPTTATLPENQLKFYIHFSAPMGRGEAYEHMRLLDAKGQAIDLPFLELNEELWDATGKRLTLLIDPGRIKRGLKPREDLGPVLESGREYTLMIDRGWRDAAGRTLRTDYQKRFRTVAAVEEAVDESAWKLISPPADSKEPFVVKFPRPMDHALVERTITVVRADGTRVAGSAKSADEERRWEFRPEKSWSAGKYQLEVDTTLEDLAGNRIGRPFEVDQLGTRDKRTPGETATMPFKIGS